MCEYKLKPCPLCGREVKLRYGTTEGLSGLSIGCTYCQLYKEWSGLYNPVDKRKFIDEWNTRTQPRVDKG